MPMPPNIHHEVMSAGFAQRRVTLVGLADLSQLPVEVDRAAVLEKALSCAIPLLNARDRARLAAWLGVRNVELGDLELSLRTIERLSRDDLGTALGQQIAGAIHHWLDGRGDPPGAGAAFIPTTTGDLVAIDDLIGAKKQLSGGLASANNVWKVTLKDGTEHVVKTETLASKALARLLGVTDQNRWEVAAYRIDRLMGLDMVPETHLVTLGGKEFVQQAWNKGETPRSLDKRKASIRDSANYKNGVADMHAFDYLICNLDRHKGNWLINPETGRIILIDNGMAGSTRRPFYRSGGKPRRVTRAFLEKVQRLDEDDLKKALHTVLDLEAIRRLLERRDALLAGVADNSIEVIA